MEEWSGIHNARRTFAEPILEHLCRIDATYSEVQEILGISNVNAFTQKLWGMSFSEAKDFFRNLYLGYYAFDDDLPHKFYDDFPVRLSDYYSKDLIDELINKGVELRPWELVGITRNRGENKIIWLDDGTSSRGFDHILLRQAEDFKEFFGTSGPYEIANFIFRTISRNQVYKSFEGGSPGSKDYFYKFGIIIYLL